MQVQTLKNFEHVRQKVAMNLKKLSQVITEYDTLVGNGKENELAKEYESSKSLGDIIEEQRNSILEGKFKLLILGEFSTGKSTFLNALVKEKILPVAIRPTTATINKITYSEEKKVRLQFWGDFDNNGNEITTGATQEISVEQLKEYTTALSEKANEISQKIKIVEISYPTEYCKNSIEILDTPGLASTNEHHDRVTLNYLPNGNACIMILNPGQPLSKSERDYLRMIRNYISKVLFVVNKIDLLDDDERSDALEYIAVELKKELQSEKPIKLYPINAKLAVSGDWKTSEFGKFISELELFLTSDQKAKELIIPSAMNAINNIRTAKRNVEIKVKSYKISPEEFEKRIQENLPKLEKLKRRTTEILQFINDRKQLLLNKFGFDLTNIFRSKLEMVSEKILNWDEDVAELKGFLPVYLKEVMMDISNEIQKYLYKEINFIQKETSNRFNDFMKDMQDYQNSIYNRQLFRTNEISAAKKVDDISIVDLAINWGGNFGIGYLSAMLLGGPLSWIAMIGGTILFSSYLAEKRIKRQLNELEYKVTEELSLEFKKIFPDAKNLIDNALNDFIDTTRVQMNDLINSVEKTIADIKNEKKLKMQELQAKIDKHKNVYYQLNHLEKSFLEVIEVM